MWQGVAVANLFYDSLLMKILLAMLVLFGGLARLLAAERLTVAVLTPHNLSGDTNTDYARYAVLTVLHSQLTEVKSIRLAPESSIKYAFRILKLDRNQALTADQVPGSWVKPSMRPAGDLAELPPGGGKMHLGRPRDECGNGQGFGKEVALTAADWFQVVSNCVQGLPARTGRWFPSPEERIRMDRPVTTSADALDWHARWCFGQTGTRLNLWRTAKRFIRKALAIDPSFEAPLEALAVSIILSENKTNEAAEMICGRSRRIPIIRNLISPWD